MRPSAGRSLAAGEKNPDNPVNPVYIKIIKIESIPHPFNYFIRESLCAITDVFGFHRTVQECGGQEN